MESISEGATLPVPFNIIPTPKTIYYLIKKINRLILNKKGTENENVDEDLANKVRNLFLTKKKQYFIVNFLFF